MVQSTMLQALLDRLPRGYTLDEEDWQAIAESQVANSYEPYLALDQDPSTLSRLDRFEPLRPSLSAGAVQALDLSVDSEQG